MGPRAVAPHSYPIRVCHVITGLKLGGAEAMLAKVIKESDKARFAHSVVSLAGEGPVAAQLRLGGIEVNSLKVSTRTVLSEAFRLRKIGKRIKPNIVVGWMYHGNLGASVLSLSLRDRPPVLWGIRQTLYDFSREKPGTTMAIRLGALLSRRVPRRIIYNSRVAARQHAALGYDATREVIIPNGFDLARFAPSVAVYKKVRRDLGLSAETVVVGMVARFHPMKRHELFIEAIPSILEAHPETHFVMVGHGVTQNNSYLSNIIARLGINGHLSLLGERTDIDQIIPALDILCMPSAWGEGFPNVVGEAMSSEVPCVVTDVGDAVELLGPAGIVVGPNSMEELARGVNTLLAEGPHGRQLLGRAGRKRVGDQYPISSISQQFDAVFQCAFSE